MDRVIDRALVADYYARIAKIILPHLRRRPMSFKRIAGGDSFWEKDAPSFTPAWVKRFAVPRRDGSPIDYILVDNARTLAWLANIGTVELHPFLHKVPKIDVATSIVFDLDPGEGAGLRECARVAFLLREALPLESYAKVSGGKGLQVYVPLNDGRTTHAVTETFARLVADQLARRHPKLIVSKMAKLVRRGKVFIDWSQNADYRTTVAVYSLRETGFVSMPVRWEELERPRGLRFTPEEALARVKTVGDLFAPVETLKQSLGVAPRPRQQPKPDRKRAARGRTQSSRRLFLITKTETGNELWLDFSGRFRRFILRPDREGGAQLIAMPAGEFPIDPAYARGEVPRAYAGRVTIEERGTFEIVDGSWESQRFVLWFSGRLLAGKWTLEKISASPRHRSWRLSPAAR